ncbi:pentapeptide repeat-containing protein [Candidatus Babeliales bacterium]|nr:pentapeptide repeat-containing protein [Candidatus Babeliales bacterium]
MKKIFFIFVLIIYLCGGSAYTYDINALEEATSGSKYLRYSHLSGAPLRRMFLWHVDLSHSDLSYARLSGAELPYTDLYRVNLSHADLSHALLVRIKLHETKVEGANFYGAIGLTNVKKKYLREHGAINVPEDRPEEEKEMEIVFKAGPWITGPLNISKKVLSFIFLTIPKHIKKQLIDSCFFVKKIKEKSK